MNKKQYNEQRNALLAEAEGLIAEGKFEEATAKQETIKELDNKFESITKEMANLNALKEQGAVDLENKSATDAELQNTIKVNEKGDLNSMENAEKLQINAFAKTVMGKELSAQETQAFEMNNMASTDNTGVVVPETTMNEIIGLVSEQYPFFGDAKKYNVTGIVQLPKHKAIKSGDAKGYKEGISTEVEENEFVRVTLKGVEVAKLIEVTFKLEAMSIPAFMEYLKGELVDRIGAVVGKWVYTGDASTELEFEGVIKVLETAKQSEKYSGAIAFEVVTRAMGKLASQFQNGAAVYVNNSTLWNKLAAIVDTTNRPIFITDASAGGVGRLFGMPVKVDGGCPDGVVVIGKPSNGYAVNTNKALAIDSAKDLKSRSTQFLGHAVMDGKVTDERAFVAIIPEA